MKFILNGNRCMQIGPTDWHTQFLLVYFAKNCQSSRSQAAMSLHNICLLCSRGECIYMAMSTTNIFAAEQPPQQYNPLFRLENKGNGKKPSPRPPSNKKYQLLSLLNAETACGGLDGRKIGFFAITNISCILKLWQ